MTTIGILEGSLRKASLSRAYGRCAAGLAPEGTSIVHLPSSEELPHFNQDVLDAGMPKAVTELGDAVAKLDALLIVTPEYNWSVPGSLKNAIDWLSRLKPVPLEGMPVAIWTVSPGLLGGARVHESLRHILHSQGMHVMAKPEAQVGGAMKKIDMGAGTITHEDTANFLQAHLQSFSDYSRRFAP